jgi:hypothetical protein
MSRTSDPSCTGRKEIPVRQASSIWCSISSICRRRSPRRRRCSSQARDSLGMNERRVSLLIVQLSRALPCAYRKCRDGSRNTCKV